MNITITAPRDEPNASQMSGERTARQAVAMLAKSVGFPPIHLALGERGDAEINVSLTWLVDTASRTRQARVVLRRMQAIHSVPFANQQDASSVSVVVDVESFNGRTADGRRTDEAKPIGRPSEVFGPLIATRIEKRDDR